MENQASKPADHVHRGALPNRAVLLEQARATKVSPGVYLMKDETGAILYVGKAKVLPNRLASYFQTGPHEIPRTEMLVNRIHHFDVILTETEAEALILECTLIKKHKPKFNVRLKDDKAYPYLKIQLADRFPRIEWTRRVYRDGAKYFGPFPSAASARQVMYLLNETFRLRDCSDNAFRHRSRPCILYQMGKCSGACIQGFDERHYRESIAQAIAVLEGKTDRLEQTLRKGMEDAASREEYETAAEYRDQLRNLELVTETQVAVEAGSQRDRDVIHVARKESEAHGTLLRIRGGRLISIQHYHLQNVDPSLSDSELIYEFIAQYYINREEREGEPPAQEILLPLPPRDRELLEQTLGVTVRVFDPGAAGPEEKIQEQLLNVAYANAAYALEQTMKRTAGHGLGALEEVQEKLHLVKLPYRIECYDISNIQGQDAVASRVVFVNGAPEKGLYRRYKIRTVEGANDFAMMKEVLGRRFSHRDEDLPDLVLVDGGKGQLAQAEAILEELSVQGVCLAGLAKARVERDFQAKEVKSSLERVFIPNRKNPISLIPHTDAYKLLTHVRDEAHRFAISYHRLLRGKRALKTDSGT
ncbi:MAG: excinuclease ABC subunit C [Bdellovibrionales bacterium RIFOXYD1_FULL_55_31]|nr:MAG: excinuclease ABC subunit C [Bdellovibrionales bacterium RIFOXYD1_FULL_55_31]